MTERLIWSSLASGPRYAPGMEGYDASTYGERIADVYDEWYAEAEFLETDAVVAMLAELAGAGPLAPGGLFVIEAFMPEPERFQGRVGVSRLEANLVQLDMSLVDRAEQRSESQHIVLTPDGVRLYPVRIRWAYPAELDLMARL